MITNNLVEWELHEWNPIIKNLKAPKSWRDSDKNIKKIAPIMGPYTLPVPPINSMLSANDIGPNPKISYEATLA